MALFISEGPEPAFSRAPPEPKLNVKCLTSAFEKCAHLINLGHMLIFPYPEISRQRAKKQGLAWRFLIFFFFFLLKASLVEKAEGQNSANNILTYTGETQGTEKGAALLSKVWGCCHCQVSKAAKSRSMEMPALVGTPGTVKDCKYAKPHNCTMNAQKVGIWLTSSFKRN